MSSPPKIKDDIIQNISADFPDVDFALSDGFKWDPQSKRIHHKQLSNKESAWSLLHEVGHMVLDHADYKSDFELLKMEVSAWHEAKAQARKYGLDISQEHIEKCIDSYRDWLHGRSKCRNCDQNGLEKTTGVYGCFNCGFSWRVTPSRFCRVYRKGLVASD
jgi:hypothetical protein